MINQTETRNLIILTVTLFLQMSHASKVFELFVDFEQAEVSKHLLLLPVYAR